MKKYKVYVYAICKNEEKHVDRWVNSMKEADHIYVLDTGSTDQTVNELKKHGVTVITKKIKPWRFDVARNESLKLVPFEDAICVCTDLDEVFEKGWRNKLEEIWNDSMNRLGYTYHWSLDENDQPLVSFYIEKIHSRFHYTWTHPVHEVLTYQSSKQENKKFTEQIVLKHYPDSSKSRSSYLPLLELSVKEDPDDDRNMHYLGREYMYYGKWNEAIDTLIKHLHLPTATWKDERCASMRFIARCYQNLNRFEEAHLWLSKAVKEAPYLRDPYMEEALLYYEEKNWKKVEKYCRLALKIKTHPKTYINEVFSWNEKVYDLLSLSCYYQGKYHAALKYIKKAIEINPHDDRLKENQKFIQKLIKTQ